MNKKIEIYTDGSCLKNPGPGSFAFLIINYEEKKLTIYSKFYSSTTNNQMEMSSSLFAMKYINDNSFLGLNIAIFTDSQYLKNGINSWIINWKKNNWRTAGGDPVKNKDLWIDIDLLNNILRPSWFYVKAHDSNIFNNIVDKIANQTSKNGIELKKENIYCILREFLKNDLEDFNINII